jgi:hypothetical protein
MLSTTPACESAIPLTNVPVEGETTATPIATPTPGGTTVPQSILAINISFPDGTNFNAVSVDLTIELPHSAIRSDLTTVIDVEAPRGDILLDGLSGVMDITGGTFEGDITLKNLDMAAGSHVSASDGKITFNGGLARLEGKPSTYILSGREIDATLPENLNMTVDIYTNGEIKSEFPIPPEKIENDKGQKLYHGDLNPTGITTDILLSLHAGSKDVRIHKRTLSEIGPA